MADRVVYTGFDPAFGDRLNELIARAKAEGYAPELISGRRDAYGWPGMKGQSQAELYSQLGQPGGPKAAAPPGYSPHQYGLAGDVTGIPQSELERLAPQVGLRAIHSDPNHVELQNWQQTAATQPPMMAWDQSNPANVPTQMAMNMEGGGPSQPGRPASPTPIPGGMSHADFIRSYAQQIGVDPNLALGIANAEGLRAWSAKNPNAASTVDVQNGQPFSFGDFQLNVRNGLGTQALKAGVDPRDPNQWQAADKFALDQMKAGGVGPWKGDAFAKQYLATGNVPPLPAMPGMTLNTTGPGGSGPAAGGSPLATALSAAGQALGGGPAAAGAPAAPQSPLTKALTTAGKTLGGGKGGGSGADDQQPSMPQMQLAPPMVSGAPMMLGPGGQNSFGLRAAEQNLAAQGFQTQPSLQYGGSNAMPSPIGTPSPGGTPIGAATGIPGLPGTTLNSPSQLQMALMTGQLSPYDLYAQQQAAGGGGSNYYG